MKLYKIVQLLIKSQNSKKKKKENKVMYAGFESSMAFSEEMKKQQEFDREWTKQVRYVILL